MVYPNDFLDQTDCCIISRYGQLFHLKTAAVSRVRGAKWPILLPLGVRKWEKKGINKGEEGSDKIKRGKTKKKKLSIRGEGWKD